jgi:hypothetical protein
LCSFIVAKPQLGTHNLNVSTRCGGTCQGKEASSSLQIKYGLLISHGVPVPVDGVSVCQFCLTFGRERKPSTQPARGGRRRRSPSLKPWTAKDFSRARVEEHYALSHPKQITSFQCAIAKDQSVSAVGIFFSANKLDAHYDRAREGGSDIFISYEVGFLLKSVYEKDYDFASNNPEVRCISALALEEVDSSDTDDSCDESNNVRRRGYIATILCRRTFIHVLDLVKIGLSYRQVEASMSLARRIIPKAMSMLKPVSRQTFLHSIGRCVCPGSS